MLSKNWLLILTAFLFLTCDVMTLAPTPIFSTAPVAYADDDEDFDTQEEIIDELDDVAEEDESLEDQEEAEEEHEEEVVEEIKKQ